MSDAFATLASGKEIDGTDAPMQVQIGVDSLPVKISDIGGDGALNAKVVASASIATGQAVAGVVSGALVAARAGRHSLSIRNTHATDSIYIGPGTVSAANGFLLKAGESIPVNTAAAINGIRAGSNDVTVCYLEEY
jgi:hypothetical protein